MGAFAQNETRHGSNNSGVSAFSGAATHSLDSTVHIMEGMRLVKQAFEFDAVGNLSVSTEFANMDETGNEWTNVSREKFEHDSNGNVTMNTSYSWDDQNDVWTGTIKQRFEFDANGNQVLHYSYMYMQLTNEWVAGARNVAAFDADGNQTMSASYLFTGTEWMGFFKSEYAFDSRGNVELVVTFMWDFANSDWEEESRHEFRNEYTDDTDGRVIEFYVYLRIDEDEYIRVARTYFEYDTDGNLIEKTSYIWRQWGGGAWIGEEKFRREYDSAGNRILEISYMYDLWGGAGWEESEKIETTFNNEGRITIFYILNGSQWEETSRVTYDSNGNTLTRSSINEWDGVEFGSKVRFEYDLTISLTSVLFPPSLAGELEATMYNKPTIMIRYIRRDGAWLEADYINFYYTKLDPTGTPERPSAVSISVFPNPVSESFVISGIEENTVVTIVDLNGRTVLQQIVSPNQSISVGHLPQGMFLVRANGAVVKIIRQ